MILQVVKKKARLLSSSDNDNVPLSKAFLEPSEDEGIIKIKNKVRDMRSIKQCFKRLIVAILFHIHSLILPGAKLFKKSSISDNKNLYSLLLFARFYIFDEQSSRALSSGKEARSPTRATYKEEDQLQ